MSYQEESPEPRQGNLGKKGIKCYDALRMASIKQLLKKKESQSWSAWHSAEAMQKPLWCSVMSCPSLEKHWQKQAGKKGQKKA